jgi:hypothetical protein
MRFTEIWAYDPVTTEKASYRKIVSSVLRFEEQLLQFSEQYPRFEILARLVDHDAKIIWYFSHPIPLKHHHFAFFSLM